LPNEEIPILDHKILQIHKLRIHSNRKKLCSYRKLKRLSQKYFLVAKSVLPSSVLDTTCFVYDFQERLTGGCFWPMKNSVEY
jgi:hypothetical protein